jgi:hypothetical protein
VAGANMLAVPVAYRYWFIRFTKRVKGKLKKWNFSQN